MDDTVFVNNMLDCIRAQERQILRLQRRLGRKSWHLNQARKQVAELQAEVADMKASKDGLARQLGKEQRKVAELQAAANGETNDE